MISYAQNYEDVILNRIFPSDYKGFYVDVGACHPLYDSVTNHFYTNGWTGINIEPVRSSYDELLSARDKDININSAIGSENGNLDIFITESFANSTCNKNFAKVYESDDKIIKTESVPVYTLVYIWENYVNGQEVDFLKIDVEGFEKEVLLGADFTKVNPKIIIIESTIPNSPKENFKEWENLLLDNYDFFYFDGLNRFYHRKDYFVDIPSVSIPPNVFDRFIRFSEFKSDKDVHRLVSENSDLIKQLNDKINSLSIHETGILRIEHELDTNQKNLTLKEAELKEAANAYDEMSASLADKDKALVAYQESIAQKEAELKEAASAYDEMSASLAEKDKALVAYQESIAQKEAELKEAASAYDKMSASLADKDISLMAYQESIAQKEAELKEAASAYDEMSASLAEKDKVLVAYQESIAQKEAELKEAAEAYKTLENSFAVKDKEIVAYCELIEQTNVELKYVAQSNQDINSILAEKESNYQELYMTWIKKESEITTAYISLQNILADKNQELEVSIGYCSKLSNILESKESEIRQLNSEIESLSANN